MSWGINIRQKSNDGSSTVIEVWFHKNFIGFHFHGWADESNKKQAEGCTRHRYIWGKYYIAMETIVPFYAIKKLIFSPTCWYNFIKWFFIAWKHERRNKCPNQK